MGEGFGWEGKKGWVRPRKFLWRRDEEIAVNKDTEGEPTGAPENRLHFWFYFRLLGGSFLKSILRRILRLLSSSCGRVPGSINDVCNGCGRGELDYVCHSQRGPM